MVKHMVGLDFQSEAVLSTTHNKFSKNYLQATSINIELNTANQLTLALALASL